MYTLKVHQVGAHQLRLFIGLTLTQIKQSCILYMNTLLNSIAVDKEAWFRFTHQVGTH